MAQSNFTVLDNSLSISSIARGPIVGVDKPNGGGNFVHGFNSLTAVNGSSGLYVNNINFSPITSGGQITAAISRGLGPADTGISVFAFFCLQGTDVADQGYLLGLSDNEPSRIILRKGTINGGIPDLTPDPTVNGNLMASTTTYSKGEWVHLRLDVIVNTNGEVILQVFQNDLEANPVTTPIWEVPEGMDGPFSPEITGFVDDPLQINSGSAPLLSGRAGMAVSINGAARRGFFDEITLARKI
jgi:hypothetical protein